MAEVSSRSYDLIDKVVGTMGAGRIGQELMQRLKVNTVQTSSFCESEVLTGLLHLKEPQNQQQGFS